MKQYSRFFLLPFLLCYVTVHSQTITITEKASLPSVINESSSAQTNNRNKIWSNNDSGGNPELYGFDSTGTLTRTLTISGATNTDWEELAHDTSGNFYIGDFGNNANDRTNLKIYKIPNPDSVSGNSVTAQVIRFTYSDQNAFPPINSKKHFDMEAFIHSNNSLYLFSKNRTSPYNGYTYLYKLPDTAGTFVAELIDSFYLGPNGLSVHSVTAGDINPDHTALALISNTMLFLFTGFTGDNFFSGTMQALAFTGTVTQKEGVCFTSNTELYITDEKTGSTGGKLYDCSIAAYMPVMTSINNTTDKQVCIYPNPTTGIINIDGNAEQIEIFNLLGEKIMTVRTGTNRQTIDLSGYPKGMYLLSLIAKENKTSHKILLD